MCGFNFVGVTLVFAEATAPQDPYVQPRSRKIRSKIGIGIPRSQSKMYPAAPACLILFVKRISDILNVIDLELFFMPRELALITETHNRDNE